MKKKKIIGIIAVLLVLTVGAVFALTQKGEQHRPAETAAPEGMEKPISLPTEGPTVTPTEELTATPTEEVTATPTEEPTATPTEKPTEAPTEAPAAEKSYLLEVRDLQTIMDLYPAETDTALDSDDAFARGNECYKNGEYAEARGYYLLALKKIDGAKLCTKGDVCNNLALTLLHLEEKEAAYALCRYNLENNLAPTDADRYGYMMNLLVSAHANAIPAAKELRDALAGGYFSFDDLSSVTDEDPSTYSKLLVGLVYNVVYMDMEKDLFDVAASWYYLPKDRLEVTAANVMEELSVLTEGYNQPEDNALRNSVNERLDRKQYLKYLREILEKADEWNKKTFGEYDPDIGELKKYLDALSKEDQ